jgi:hypothetical protein
MDLANLFRENLQLCCCSASLSLYHCRCLLLYDSETCSQAPSKMRSC